MSKIELYPHNEETYRKIREMFASSRRACSVQPTGTGKTFLGLRLNEDSPGKRVVILSPEVAIFDEFRKNAEKSNASEILENTEFLTYQGLAAMDDLMRDMIKPQIIILDEFHRIGAEIWGAAALALLEKNPDAFVLGLTATPIRYLDGGRNMGEELFYGQYACYMTAGEAVGMGILPNPIFVSGIYENDGLLNRYRKQLKVRKDSKARKKTQELLDQMELMRRNLQHSYGVDAILKKYMPTDHGKYIVFCRDILHLKELMEKFPSWINGINYRHRFYVSVAESSDCDSQLEAFRKDEGEDALRLLFCVDRLNEGVHVSDIDGVMMFRPTISPIIYLQQIGRALSVNGKTPVIFDFVNNRHSIKRMLGKDPFEEGIRKGGGGFLSDREIPEFRFAGQEENYLEIIKALDDILYPDREDLWQESFAAAKAYYAANGIWPPQSEGPLGQWCNRQRHAKKKGALTEHREKQLLDAGFVFDLYEAQWQENFAAAKAYYAANGTWPPRSEGPLGNWCDTQRQARKNGTLDRGHEKQLLEAGFIINAREAREEARWQESFAAVKAYYAANGIWPPRSEGPLGIWCNRQRAVWKKGTLKPHREALLQGVGFFAHPK